MPALYINSLDGGDAGLGGLHGAWRKHLQWMLQKDALGQDMFLIGPPGPARRRLAMAFCEAVNRDLECVRTPPPRRFRRAHGRARRAGTWLCLGTRLRRT